MPQVKQVASGEYYVFIGSKKGHKMIRNVFMARDGFRELCSSQLTFPKELKGKRFMLKMEIVEV